MIDNNAKNKTIVIGNGINRTYGVLSWDELLGSIKTRAFTEEEMEVIKNIPYPLQPVILAEDTIDKKMKEVAENLTSFIPSVERHALGFASDRLKYM